MQSFVDRFRAKASKARQAQSRIKALERMKPIAAIVEDSVTGVQLPHARGAVAADHPARGRQRRLRRAGRCCATSTSGSTRTTASRCSARTARASRRWPSSSPTGCAPMAGRKVASSKLRVGYFAQHQVDELELDETPLQHLQRLRPDEPPGKLRGRLAAGGIGADIVTTEVGAAVGRAEVAAGAAARHARRAAPDHPRRADQPPRHREPRRAGRGADRVRRRGDPGQPRPAPGRARRRAAVAGQGRPRHALRRRHGRLPAAAALRAQRHAGRGRARRSRSRAPLPRAEVAPLRGRGRAVRGAGRASSRRCAPRSTAGSPTRCSTPAATPRRSSGCRRSAPRSRTALARAEALWLAALERLEAAGERGLMSLALLITDLRHALRGHRPDRAGAALRRPDPGDDRADERAADRAPGDRSSPSGSSRSSASSASRC